MPSRLTSKKPPQSNWSDRWYAGLDVTSNVRESSDAVRGAALRISVGVVDGEKDSQELARYHRSAARVKLAAFFLAGGYQDQA